MRLKLYRAPKMALAMAQVRAELGEGALILATRHVGDGVEVTAALEPDEPALLANAPPTPTPMPAVRKPVDPKRVAALIFHGVPASLQGELQLGDLEPALEKTFTFTSLPLQQRPLLLAGPPGAGKTLTVAKLATRLVMSGVKPLVITADGQRAGATEQLAAFTKLLGIRLIVASHPVTVCRALTHRENDAPVLIDSAGCDAFDPAQVEELSALAGSADAAIGLVLPAGLDPAEAADMARAYAGAGANLLVATRLDLARRLGGVLAAAGAGLALTEAGVGPGAADGMLPITPAWLAGRLLTGITR
jgi:flagellar biosynthesis protein FlhF